MISFDLTDEQRLLEQSVREWAARDVAPHIADADRRHYFDRDRILGGMAQICMTQSYRLGDASLIAPFEYSSTLVALLIGYFGFGDVPAPLVWIGAAIILSAGIFVILRERALGVRRNRAASRE